MTDQLDNLNQDNNTEALLDVCAELKRGLSRLSYVGMGLSKELDQELAELRTIIKNEGELEEIKKIIDVISNILRTLDDENNTDESNEQLDLLTQLLKKELPKKLRKNLKQVQKKSRQDDGTKIMRSIVDVIQSYVSELEEDLDTDLSSKPAKKRGFFSSLFSRKEKTKEHESAEVDDSLANKPKKIDHRLPQKVRDSLQLLIDQLSSMDGYAEISNLLNHKVETISKIEQLSSILEMITSAFIEVSDQEHVQFETFLKTLNIRIKRVNDFIDHTLEFSKNTKKDGRQLSSNLSSNISGIKDSLTHSETLSDAKTAVLAHMDSIINQLDDYCENQENNSLALVSQMEKLSEQLRATEDEALRLKDDLAEQRVRAQTDPLTGLPNRYSYNERLTQEYNRWRRYRNPLTLVIGDIDLFKNVNDSYGHSFGDKVLKEVAYFLDASIRESDFIARFGGEEFVILLPETGIVDATRAMNKIRSSISKLEIKDGANIVPISISFGISEFESDDTAKTVFERADKALYRAKEKGRNRVCCQRGKTA